MHASNTENVRNSRVCLSSHADSNVLSALMEAKTLRIHKVKK